jgi:hypothetical protein
MVNKMMSVALIALAGTSMAQAAERKVTKEAAPREEVVCTTERSVGSHIPTRICTTRAQRDEQARAGQDAVRRMNRPSAQPSHSGS